MAIDKSFVSIDSGGFGGKRTTDINKTISKTSNIHANTNKIINDPTFNQQTQNNSQIPVNQPAIYDNKNVNNSQINFYDAGDILEAKNNMLYFQREKQKYKNEYDSIDKTINHLKKILENIRSSKTDIVNAKKDYLNGGFVTSGNYFRESKIEPILKTLDACYNDIEKLKNNYYNKMLEIKQNYEKSNKLYENALANYRRLSVNASGNNFYAIFGEY